jgi:hypothetical protein
MAMFPPTPPDLFPQIKAGSGFSTSEFFRQQERAFFAKSGREIVRLRVMEVDAEPAQSRGRKRPRDKERYTMHEAPPRQRPHPTERDRLMAPPSPRHTPLAPLHHPPPPERHFPGGPPPPSQARHLPPSASDIRHPPSTSPRHTHMSPRERSRDPKMERGREYQHHGGYDKPDKPEQDSDDDEAWRRPMPYNERRRAGKHTKRIVKSGNASGGV